MQSLAQLGERAAALAQYERYCDILAEEFAVAPNPELQTFAQTLRTAGAIV